ncbi:MAG: adenylyl-sulfate kinase [Rhodospirillaceae bacterium TMED8]|nr:adenylyl-sulfate kinase [Magnetovibrio sp.]MAH85463.1 adenylyl-sulfate kinase [Magnetovibrio sp.]OUT47967.1 MAG: adenylyl-sulfate kinase [Rhodospirillaceae bacterium TMED8]OUT51311.1 MAG: adenylyl-sulfate kinase [Rhodospirillaceae bacterium TMED8]
MVIWIIGLSGAGKTAIGREVCNQWKKSAPNTVLVDGDEIRAIVGQTKNPNSYTLAGRRANAERITKICSWLDNQDINVVCCILSIFPEMRATNREQFSEYFEVYVSVPMKNLIENDAKDLYAPAIEGNINNVVGIDIPFPEPVAADIIIKNATRSSTPKQIATKVLTAAGVIE